MRRTLTFRGFTTILPSKYPFMKSWSCSRSSKFLESRESNCMIKNLFEEYKFFPQYPDKELHITAQFFGGIIEHNLVTMVKLGLALRFVLEALRKSTDSNMFHFGVKALDRFKGRLKEYPQYCQYVTLIQHFKEFPNHLVQSQGHHGGSGAHGQGGLGLHEH